jgi:hypothetical protein
MGETHRRVVNDAHGLLQSMCFCKVCASAPYSQVADALDQPFPDNAFDLVWSMESGEHMPDKR